MRYRQSVMRDVGTASRPILPGSMRFVTVRNLAQAAGPVLFFGSPRRQTSARNGPEGPRGPFGLLWRRASTVEVCGSARHRGPGVLHVLAIHFPIPYRINP